MHSSNHGSHVCHKCGWAFPNPHPSAKHRRAHKKVCGKIEGFKENAAAHLSISDDEEDQDNGEETMENVKRQVSNRSEEEEFSDAVAEFVSSGTSSAGAQITVDVDVVEDDLNSSPIADVTEPLGNGHDNKIESPEAFNKLGSKFETTSVSDKTIKSLAPELTKEKNMSTTSLSLIDANVLESPLIEENIQTSENMNPTVLSEPSLSSRESTLVSDITTKSLAPELTKEEIISASSVCHLETTAPESPLTEENIQTSEDSNHHTVLSEPSLCSEGTTLVSDMTTKSLAPELAKEEIISATSVSPLETDVTESPLIEENIQTSEDLNHTVLSEPSLCSAETTLVSDMTPKSLAPKLAKEEIISATSVSPLETDVTESPLVEEIIQTSENLNPMVQIEENTGTHGKGEVVESLSTAEATSGKIESKASEIYLDSLKMEIFTKGDSQVITDVSDVNSFTLPADVIMGMEDVCASEQKTFVDDVCASEQKKSQCEVPLSSLGAIEAEVIELEHIGAFVEDAHVKADSDDVNICHEEKVNEKNTSIPLPIELLVEEQATLNVNDSEDPKPAKLEPSSTLDSAEETVEAVVQNLECKEGHNDFLSNKLNETGGISFPAEQAFEDKVSVGGALSKSTVEHAYAEGEHDATAVGDTSKEHPELNSSEALPETAIYDIKSSNTDTNQVICSFVEQEVQISRQTLSFEMHPQTTTGVSAGCEVVVSPEDAVNSEINSVVTCKADAVHEKNGEKCNMDEISIGEAIEVADLSTDVSDDAVDCKANNVVTRQDDTVHTEGKESVIAETCIGATAVADLSKDREFVPEDDRSYELKPNLQGAITTPLDAFTNSNEKEPLIDSSNVKQVSHGEQFLDSSEEPPVIKGGTDSSASEERTLAVIGNAVEPVQIERKLNIGSKVAQIHSGSENTKSEESLPSVIDSGPTEPRSSNIEADAKYFVEGDNTEEGDYTVKQHPEEASPIVPPEGSVDSISQTDSIEGQWGSVSDGTVPSSRYATDTPKPEDQVTDLKETKGAHMNQFHETDHIAKAPLLVSGEAGREHGLDSFFSEIQAVENQHQMEALALPASAPPPSHAVLESQGKKKNDEEIIAKVVNWSADKSRTPLRSLLVEANLESKQKTGSAQSHQNATTKKDENPLSATEEEGLSSKQVPATKPELPSIYDATKGNPGKEWNSPARLPNTREKRKVRYWVPLCCSSVN